ncbi:hypothetical protein BGZ63DRAFT_427673 [Mariannaea sp. PMI_226]|nr:hypothetical protein BGZ63DRAFT_427673 [Mariannaea sp. PMI_226]
MFCVGTVYALSTLQIELPRLLGISQSMSFAPFASACFGLSVGVGICASLVTKHGALRTTAAGTAIWGTAMLGTGYLLARSNFYGMLACFALGGIGVGLTYLAVVVMVGQGFPTQPLARSAIGPLGFSSGTAACIVIYNFYQFNVLGAAELGKMLSSGGVGILSAGLITAASLPSDAHRSKNFCTAPKSSDNYYSQTFFSTLLFFNALPGMTVFTVLLPMASNFGSNFGAQVMNDEHFHILPYGMVALGLGGFLAPPISSVLGAKPTFTLLFCVRGLMLVAFSLYPKPAMAMICLTTVLFAHGTGFSVLPGLVKARQAKPVHFTHSYGQVLISWGLSGIVSTAINTVMGSSLEGMRTVSLLLGAAALAFSITLQFVSTAL